MSMPDAGPVTDRERWIALVVLCVGMLMIVLDTTVVNVALPTIQHDLHFSESSLAWVVNAYLIAFGGFLLLAGRIGDLLGRRKIFLIGLTLFTVASLVCGLAQSRGELVVARFVQGVGGALTSAVILGMIVTMFPEPHERARAIGVYGFVASGGGALGLLAGGGLTQAVSWHWIFFVNVPIGILTGVAAVKVLQPDAGIGLRAGADVPGAVLVVGSLMLAVYTLVETTTYGWGSFRTLGLLAVAVGLLGAFVARQATAANPLVPLRLFRSRTVSAANLVQTLSVAGMFGLFFLGALYLQGVLRYDAIEVGLAFLPATLGMMAISLGVSATLITRIGALRTTLPGLGVIVLSLGLFSRVPLHANYFVDVFPSMLLLGVGAGLAFPALMTLAMSGATPADSGLASGLVSTTQQVGGALGLAVLASLSTSRSNHLLARGASAASAATGGYRLAFIVAAGLVAASLATAAFFLRNSGIAVPEAVMEELAELAAGGPAIEPGVVELPELSGDRG